MLKMHKNSIRIYKRSTMNCRHQKELYLKIKVIRSTVLTMKSKFWDGRIKNLSKKQDQQRNLRSSSKNETMSLKD